VLDRAGALGVEMPITECVVAVLAGRLSADEAMRSLMGREAGSES
jgi:glycerol-3-phosphate dehydrogenase (NAD(P)+)